MSNATYTVIILPIDAGGIGVSAPFENSTMPFERSFIYAYGAGVVNVGTPCASAAAGIVAMMAAGNRARNKRMGRATPLVLVNCRTA